MVAMDIEMDYSSIAHFACHGDHGVDAVLLLKWPPAFPGGCRAATLAGKN
jgi:hypothetical protein